MNFESGKKQKFEKMLNLSISEEVPSPNATSGSFGSFGSFGSPESFDVSTVSSQLQRLSLLNKLAISNPKLEVNIFIILDN